VAQKKEAVKEICAMFEGARMPFLISNGNARVYRLILLLLLLNPLGNFFLAYGMKQYPSALAANPLHYLLAILNPLVALGMLMLILAFLVRLALFSIADLSFMLPVTAFGYVIAALYGKFFLSEHISAERWLGTALIFVGISFVGTTSANTVPAFPEAGTADGSI
jgi:uncharacterized membrane protein